MTNEGIFRGHVVPGGWGLTKAATGTYQFLLKVKLDEEAKNPEDLASGFKPLERPLNKTIFMPITQNTKPFILQDLQFIGFDRKVISSAALIPGSPTSFDFADRPVVVQCEHSEYQGKTREKFRICRRKAATAFGREDQAQFDQLFASDEEEVDLDKVPI